MKRLLLFLLLIASTYSRASMFGEENIVLFKIFFNALQQLAQLQKMVKAGGDTLNLMQEINRGINDSLKMIRTINPDWQQGIYGNWDNPQDALAELERIYGSVATSTTETQVQTDTDQGIAEAVSLNNSVYDHAKEIDRLGEEIKSASHFVSPGGAQKLTAQALGVMLHVMNSNLRTQATALKLQAQTAAIHNRQSKENTKHAVSSIESMRKEFRRSAKFGIPRF